jgi:hypothetical protein
MSNPVEKTSAVGNFVFDSDNQERRSWVFFGQKIARSQIVFLVQVALVTIIAIVSIINLTLSNNCQDTTIWVAILSSSLGYMLPAPSLK